MSQDAHPAMPVAPAASLEESLGRHLALLGRALQLRSHAHEVGGRSGALQALAAEAVLADLAQRDAELEELLGPEGDASEALGEPSSPLGEAKDAKAAPPGANPPRMPSDPAELDGKESAWAQLPGALSLAEADESQDARQAGRRLSLQVPADGSPKETVARREKPCTSMTSALSLQIPVEASGTMAAHRQKTVMSIATSGQVLGESIAAEAGTKRQRTIMSIMTNKSEHSPGRLRSILSMRSRGSSSSQRPGQRSRTKDVDDLLGGVLPSTTSVGRLVASGWFQCFFAVLIGLNAVVMAVEEQYMGARVGREIGFYEEYGSASPASDGWLAFFTISEIVFAIVFSFEALMRMAARGRGYWRDPLELLDLFVVACSIFGILIQSSNSMSHLMTLRLLRTIKVLRMIKLIRKIETLDTLHLMTAALSASCQALFWAIILLFCMQSFIALMISNILREHYLIAPGVLREEQKRELFEYFGTYSRSMLSTFELTLANWPPICRFMVENLHEGWMLFAVFYKLTFGFAVVGVVNAVFMQETFKVASLDDSIMVKQKTRAFNAHKQKMEKLFKRADLDSSGKVSLKEFRAAIRDPAIKIWLQSMDIEASDAELLFTLIKNGKASDMTVEDLIQGVARLKGNARSMDVQRALMAMKEQRRAAASTDSMAIS